MDVDSKIAKVGVYRLRPLIVVIASMGILLLFTGLFEAVEHQDMDQVKLILDSNGLDVNR